MSPPDDAQLKHTFKYMCVVLGAHSPMLSLNLINDPIQVHTCCSHGVLGVPMQLGAWLWHSFSNDLGTHERLAKVERDGSDLVKVAT